MWDDSDMTPSGVGGRCLNSWQASKRLKDGRGSLEEVVVSLAHDAHLAGANSFLCFQHCTHDGAWVCFISARAPHLLQELQTGMHVA